MNVFVKFTTKASFPRHGVGSPTIDQPFEFNMQLHDLCVKVPAGGTRVYVNGEGHTVTWLSDEQSINLGQVEVELEKGTVLVVLQREFTDNN